MDPSLISDESKAIDDCSGKKIDEDQLINMQLHDFFSSAWDNFGVGAFLTIWRYYIEPRIVACLKNHVIKYKHLKFISYVHLLIAIFFLGT